MKKLTLEQFIKKAKLVHGNKYDYSKTIYLNGHKKVIIICKKHGNFYQEPANHLFGNGCQQCSIDKHKVNKQEKSLINKENTNRFKYDINKFIEKAKSVHGDKYDYSKVQYTNSKTKITITCKEHGDFYQLPSFHIRGNGCKKCHMKKLSELKKLTLEEFIDKANKVHNYKYTYSKTNYNKSNEKILITCFNHGDFYQEANSHLRGIGCPLCNASKGEQVIKAILDKYNIKYIREYKIPNQIYKFRYDFYLPDYHLLIEFHGRQHYEPVEAFGGEEEFKNILFRDACKRELANLLKLHLLEFNYKHLLHMKDNEFEHLIVKRLGHFVTIHKGKL